jgi:exodeoxyribonuclease-3
MKIASWNVNSLKVRLPHLTQWLSDAQPDIVALQETKLEDGKFPVDELAAAGYRAVFSRKPITAWRFSRAARPAPSLATW